MNIDYTIGIGNIIEIISILGGGFAVFITLKNNVENLKTDVETMQDEVKKLTEVCIRMADMSGDIKALSHRMTTAEIDIRELRHGEGFVRGSHGIDREFP